MNATTLLKVARRPIRPGGPQLETALLAIRDGRLYRSDYRTFEEYCECRWKMSATHAHRLVDAATVIENLKNSPIGESLPATESQARPLAALLA